MNRQECESKILEKLEEIEEIHKQYNPNADYLLLSIRKDVLRANNAYWVTIDDIGADCDYPIDCVKYREEENEV